MSSAESDSYQSKSSGRENLSDIWSDDGEEKELPNCLKINYIK